MYTPNPDSETPTTTHRLPSNGGLRLVASSSLVDVDTGTRQGVNLVLVTRVLNLLDGILEVLSVLDGTSCTHTNKLADIHTSPHNVHDVR